MIRSARTLCAVFLTLCLPACGGSGSDAKSPGGESASDRTSSSGDTGAADEGDSAAEEVPAGPDCSDGTCFECGGGICPQGAYCDQNSEGGAACAWLPECSGAPTCGCISGVLKGCSCDDASGAPMVSCQ
jgi:hypothetical protein